MTTIGEFLDEIKGEDEHNFSGHYALQLVAEAAPEGQWEPTLSKELTHGMAAALLDAVSSRLEEVKGYNETEDGLQLVDEEIKSFLIGFHQVAIRHGFELS